MQTGRGSAAERPRPARSGRCRLQLPSCRARCCARRPAGLLAAMKAPEQPGDLACRLGNAEQVALHLGAALGAAAASTAPASPRLPPWSPSPEQLPNRGDRPDDCRRVLVMRQVANERLVDLDLVERKAAQIAQRGIAGAEIVHRDAARQARATHAGWPGPARYCATAGPIRLFPDRAAVPASRSRASASVTVTHQIVALNCTGERLTATFTSSGQLHGLPASLAQRPSAKRHDQTHFLGQPDECARITPGRGSG